MNTTSHLSCLETTMILFWRDESQYYKISFSEWAIIMVNQILPIFAVLLLTTWSTVTSNTPLCQENPVWPRGMYSLPRAEGQQCPSSWAVGDRLQDTETALVPLIGGNDWSDPCHLMGPYTTRRITWNFCTKNTIIGDPVDVDWAPGDYCIMKKGTTCPSGERTW